MGAGAEEAFALTGRLNLGRKGAVDIKAMRVDLHDLALEFGQGELVVGGRLALVVEYVGRDGRVRVREDGGPFSRRVALDGVGGAAEACRGIAVSVRALQWELRLLPGRGWGREVDYRVEAVVRAAPADAQDAAAVTPAFDGPEAADEPGEAVASRRFSSRLLRVEEVIGEERADFLVEERLVIEKPAIKVIDVHWAVTGLRGDAVDDSVIIQGTLSQQVYYVGEDGLIHYQHGDTAFEGVVPVPGAAGGMNVRAAAEVQGSEHELTEGQVLLEKCTVRVTAKVTRTAEVNILTDLIAPPGVRVATDTIHVEQVVGRGETRHLVEGSTRLAHPGQRVIRATAGAGPTSVQVLGGKVVVEGVIRQQLFYIGRDGMEYHQAEETPFSTFMDVPGAAAGMSGQVEAAVESLESELDQRDHLLRHRVVLRLTALVTEAVSLGVVTAVEGPGVEVESRQLKVERLVTQAAAQIMVVHKAGLVSRAIRIVDVIGSVRDIAAEVIPDEVIVQGRVHQQVFFIDRHKVQRHQTEEAVFNHLVEAPGARPGMLVAVQPFVKYISTALAPEANVLSERIVLDLHVRVVEPVSLTAVSGVRLPPTDGEPSHPIAQPAAPRPVTFSLSGSLVPAGPPPDRVEEVAAVVVGAGVREQPGGRAALAGVLRLRVCYVARNGHRYRHEERVPFEHELGVDRVAAAHPPGVRVRDLHWEAAGRGGRGLAWQALLEADVQNPSHPAPYHD